MSLLVPWPAGSFLAASHRLAPNSAVAHMSCLANMIGQLRLGPAIDAGKLQQALNSRTIPASL